MGAELIPLLVIVAVFYFLLIRPGQARAKAARATVAALAPGARIMTTAGLYATVVAVEDDAVVLETSPGTTSRWAKAAVAKILPDPSVDSASTEEGQPRVYDEDDALLERLDPDNPADPDAGPGGEAHPR